MGSRLDLAEDVRRPPRKLTSNFIPKIELPLWMRIGLTKRRRGYLGTGLLFKKKTGIPYGNIFNAIAQNEEKLDSLKEQALERINQQRLERAERKDKPFKPKKRSIRHMLLGIIAYVVPSLSGGLASGAATMAAGGPFGVGFGVQVVDAARLDVGQTVLDTIKDNDIDIKNPDRIRAAMETPKVLRDIYVHSAMSVAIEGMIAYGSWQLGEALAGSIESLAESVTVSTEPTVENLSHSIARAAPASTQSTLQKTLAQLSRPFGMAVKTGASTALEKTVEVTGEGIKYGARVMTKRSTQFAMKYITKDTLPLLIAQHGEAAGRALFEAMKESGELQEIPEKKQINPYHRVDEEGRIFYNPEAWTGPPRGKKPSL